MSKKLESAKNKVSVAQQKLRVAHEAMRDLHHEELANEGEAIDEALEKMEDKDIAQTISNILVKYSEQTHMLHYICAEASQLIATITDEYL